MTQPKTYIRDESENSDVSAILVVETGDEGVRVTENREAGWSKAFWMPEQEFRANTHGDSIETVGLLPDAKFDAVVEKAEA